MAVVSSAYTPSSNNWDDLTAATHPVFSGTTTYSATFATN